MTRPSYEISKGEHAYINHTYKYPGRVTWNDITITMVDPIDLDLTGRISEMIRQSGYIIPSRHYEDSQGVPHGRTISKTRATDILLNFELILMDPDENPVERWRLYHPWISNVDNGDLDYTSEDLVDTTLTITYDWASPETVIVENGIIVGDSKIVWNPNADAFSR